MLITILVEQLKKDLAGLTADIEEEDDARELREGDLVEILEYVLTFVIILLFFFYLDRSTNRT